MPIQNQQPLSHLITPNWKEEPHLYSKNVAGYPLSIRMVCLREDIRTIHYWVNLPYAKKFWGMQGELAAIHDYYHQQLSSNRLALFFACVQEEPVALIEVYKVQDADELSQFDWQHADYGIHLLLGPHRDLLAQEFKIKKLSVNILRVVQDFLFSYPSVGRIIAEPDIRNVRACRLATEAGFEPVRILHLKEKTAQLFMITRQNFEQNF